MNTEPEASPRTPAGETPLSTTPEIRYWQHVASGAITSDTSWAVTYHDRYREVAVTPVDGLRPDSDVIERAAQVAEEAWTRSWTDEDGYHYAPSEIVEALAAAGLLVPSGAAWHTDPPPGWSTFGAHAFMDELPGLEFWGEEYGGDGLPIWERPVPAPDADVVERIARAWDEGYTAGSQDGSIIGVGRTANPHATLPVAATGEEVDHYPMSAISMRGTSAVCDWCGQVFESSDLYREHERVMVLARRAREAAATGEGADRG